MRIIVAYRALPQSPGWATGDCVVRAAKMLGHDAHAWGNYYQTDEPIELARDDTDADLIIHMECNDSDQQYDLRRVAARRVYWEFDTAMHPQWSARWIAEQRFARVFVANSRFEGCYLPYAIDPYLYSPSMALVDRAGAACIGSPFAERVMFCREAAVPLMSGLYREQYAQATAALKISVHHHDSGGDGLIVARPWEAFASGTCLLTAKSPALRRHFEPGVHYAEYVDAKDCAEQVRWLLSHDEEREAMAYEGFAEANRKHTYMHRVSAILAEMEMR